jgi:hypothetical protein
MKNRSRGKEILIDLVTNPVFWFVVVMICYLIFVGIDQHQAAIWYGQPGTGG